MPAASVVEGQLPAPVFASEPQDPAPTAAGTSLEAAAAAPADRLDPALPHSGPAAAAPPPTDPAAAATVPPLFGAAPRDAAEPGLGDQPAAATPLVAQAEAPASDPIEAPAEAPAEIPAETSAELGAQAAPQAEPPGQGDPVPDAAQPPPAAQPAPAPVATGADSAQEVPVPAFAQSAPPGSAPQLAEAASRASRIALADLPAKRHSGPAAMPGREVAAAADLPQPAFAAPVQPEMSPGGRAMPELALPQRAAPQTSSRPRTSAQPGAREPAAGLAWRDTSPSVGAGNALFGPDDELILQIETAGGEMVDTIVAFGTRSGVYLPFGAFARFMDLAIAVGDGGNYASGWFLDESRTLTIDLHKRTLTVEGRELLLAPGDAAASEGELYLRAERFAEIFPLTLDVDLRNQSISVRTLTPFPFETRMARDSARKRLGAGQGGEEAPHWPREETPYRALSFPMGDAELRAIADNTMGKRLEGDLRLAGDLAFMTAQAFASGSSRDGITGARIELGRRDPDARLLGPLRATEFQIGDVNTVSLPLGLRGTGGRGAFVTNTPLESASVFDKVDLRGELPDGYEVELYRNNILIDSTGAPVNGQYEFLQVPVDYGLNVFRFVFYGPQGQRREEVRRVSVGDGRLAKGQLVYAFGAAQKAINVFNVHGPLYTPVDDEGSWRSSALLAYGLTSGLTASLGGAWFESQGRSNWMATAGVRTGIAGIAARLDFGVQNGGGKAVQLGLGGRLLGATYTLEHAEYRGGFDDEVNAISLSPMKRSSEFNLNTSLRFGGESGAFFVPVAARLQRREFVNGLVSTEASLRASARLGGILLSNTLDYDRTTSDDAPAISQLRGAFDLATITGSRLQFRVGAEYILLPRVDLATVRLDLDYALDNRTVLRGSVTHGFDPAQSQFGLSAIRRFGAFTLAFEGNYAVPRGDYSAALRLGFSFGRNPLTGPVLRRSAGAVGGRRGGDLRIPGSRRRRALRRAGQPAARSGVRQRIEPHQHR